MSDAKNSYSALSDDVLAELSKNSDEQAFNELVLRYLGKISFIARKYSARGYEHTDFVQEGLIGLYRAAQNYDREAAGSFGSYAMLVAERRFISIIRRQTAQKSVPETAIVGLDALDVNLADTALAPEDKLLLSETLTQVFERLSQSLSKRELSVLRLYTEGLSYSDIAARLGIAPKSVDNALQRVRRKVGSFDMS